MNIECRYIIKDDYDAWCKMYADYSSSWKEVINKKRLDEIWHLITDNENVWGIVSLSNDKKTSGFALLISYPCTYSRKFVGYIQDLYVSPEYRRMSVGKAMMEFIYSEAKKKGWHELTWKTMAANVEAQALYDKIASKSPWVHYELQCFPEKG